MARALAPRQKSEKMPSFTAEPATHSAEPATHSAGILAEIPPKFGPNLLNHFFPIFGAAQGAHAKNRKKCLKQFGGISAEISAGNSADMSTKIPQNF